MSNGQLFVNIIRLTRVYNIVVSYFCTSVSGTLIIVPRLLMLICCSSVAACNKTVISESLNQFSLKWAFGHAQNCIFYWARDVLDNYIQTCFDLGRSGPMSCNYSFWRD